MTATDTSAVIAKAVELAEDPWSSKGRRRAYDALGLTPIAQDTEERAMSPYTPTWGAAGTAPVKGSNGTLVGAFLRDGKMGDVYVRLTAGAATTFGTQQWSFTLPPNWKAKRATALDVLASDGTDLIQGKAIVAADANIVYPKLAEAHDHVLTFVASGSADTMAVKLPKLTTVDVDSPWAWATGYWIQISGRLELVEF